MKLLYMIIYNSVGLISGVVGPVPEMDNCLAYIQDATKKMIAHPKLEQLTFKCEYYSTRPKLQEE